MATVPSTWPPSTATSGVSRYAGPAALRRQMSLSSNETKKKKMEILCTGRHVRIKSAFSVVDHKELS